MSINFIKLPSFERLNELLIYDPETGDLRWKVSRSNLKAGSIAGHIHTDKDGRKDWKIQVDGKTYTSTRVIWALYHQQDPGLMTIDHRDQNSLNNRIANLRLADMHEQAMNMRTTSTSTATRYPGLGMCSYKNKRRPRWQGWIRISGYNYAFGSVAVDSINDNPPDWLIARAARLYSMHDNPTISDEDLIEEITRLKRMPPVATAAE